MRRLKNVDAGERAYRIKALVLGALFGMFGGLPVGALLAEKVGGNPIVFMLAAVVMVTVAAVVSSELATRSAGRTVQSIYNPEGTAVRREYSLADSLVARGKYEDAAAAYEVACLEHPEDPEPYFRLARLLRDHLQRHDEAAQWFERARTESRIQGLQGLVISQELIELYVHKLRTPRRAIPELMLLCERFPGTPAADGARKELEEMRELLAQERDGTLDFTEEFLRRVDRRES
ncbi:MAG: tetratricopeptide repeat protein [Gemmatimonadota bacterium]|nr:MAG: tetratricopeptide repeat protein [Gemmatimonadota bacterium]